MSRNTHISMFGKDLARVRRRWQSGLILRVMLRLLGHASTLLLAYVLMDFFLAFTPHTRMVLNTLGLSSLAAAFLAWCVAVLRVTDRDAARRADLRLAMRRRPVLSAFELENRTLDRPAAAGFGSFLVAESIGRALTHLHKLRIRDQFPLPEIGRQLRLTLVQVAVLTLMLAAHPTAGKTILSRIFHPGQDIPPYSRYTFSISPADPEVLYGGSAELSVTVGGQPVRSQVWFVTRHDSGTVRTACFQEGPDRFAQRLEKVVTPLEFCFAVGRARSKWQKVAVLLQPQIAMAEAHITPPPYSRLPARRFFVGNEKFAGLAGSEARLAITSNRPLLDGTLMISPPDGTAPETSVQGHRTAPNTVEFSWAVRSPALINVSVRDLRGTCTGDPLRIEQSLLPDLPPEAHITNPGPFALATPSVTLPLTGHVTDDLGLRRVELIRTVVGYRDRIKPLGPDAATCTFEFSRQLDLKALGAEPGQVLEFYLEAADMNPSMMGVAASDVARVQIISESEYAAMLRNRATLEQFMDRYAQAAAHVERLKKALRDLKHAADADPANTAAARAALDEAAAAADAAADFFEKLSADFPIYDLEERLGKVASAMAKTMQKIGEVLGGADPSSPTLGGMAGALLSTLGEPGARLDKEVADAKQVALVARVMSCAGRFRELVARQKELVRRLDRFRDNASRDMKLLESLGRRQDELREMTGKLTTDMLEGAAALPDTYRTLRSSLQEFAGLIAEYGIAGLMGNGADAARNHDGRQAHFSATRALEELEKLLSDSGDSPFGGMCRGEIRFQVPRDMASTMAQMLASLLRRPGDGQGIGGIGTGAGYTGPSEDGFWMGGYSPVNMPMFGPSRMMLPSSGMPGINATGGSGSGTGRSQIKAAETETIKVPDKGEIESRSMQMEMVPEKYRDAVKRYFGHE